MDVREEHPRTAAMAVPAASPDDLDRGTRLVRWAWTRRCVCAGEVGCAAGHGPGVARADWTLPRSGQDGRRTEPDSEPRLAPQPVWRAKVRTTRLRRLSDSGRDPQHLEHRRPQVEMQV